MSDRDRRAQEFEEAYKSLEADLDKHEATASSETALAYELRKVKTTCDHAKEYFRSKHGFEVKDPKTLQESGEEFLRSQSSLQAEIKFYKEMHEKFPQPELGYSEKAKNAEALLEMYATAEDHVLKEAEATPEKIEELSISTMKPGSVAGSTPNLKPIFRAINETSARSSAKSLF